MIENKLLEDLVFVTSNPNKAREASQILGVNITHNNPGELMEIQTSDVLALVEYKAIKAWEIIKSPLLVEDSGLFFDAWNGLPGAFVKWFEQSIGCSGILKMLGPFENRKAVALCCVGFNNGSRIQVVKGEVRGHIADKEIGVNGFGWDTIFIPEGYDRTYGEMSAEEKNAISHRKIALESLKKIL